MDTFTETFYKIAEQVKRESDTGTSEPLLESLFNLRISTALENTIKSDTQYQQTTREIQRKIEALSAMGLSREQWLAMDDALSACNKRGGDYGRAAYKQGFMDAINLLIEILSQTTIIAPN
jgi:hypothetical protein